MNEDKVKCPECNTEKFSIRNIKVIEESRDTYQTRIIKKRIYLEADCSCCDLVTGEYISKHDLSQLERKDNKFVCSNCECTNLNEVDITRDNLLLECDACQKTHYCEIIKIYK